MIHQPDERFGQSDMILKIGIQICCSYTKSFGIRDPEAAKTLLKTPDIGFLCSNLPSLYEGKVFF